MWKNMIQPATLHMKIYYGACALQAG